MKLSRCRPALVCAVYFCLHVAAQVSARLFEIAPGISVWYAPCGLALALLVMLGPRYAPIVFTANVVGAVLPGITTWWAPLAFPAVITANYAFAAYMIRRHMGNQLLPGTAAGTAAFTFSLLAAPVGAAVGGTMILRILNPAPKEPFFDAAASWWLGDFCGLLTVVPVIMVFVAPWLEGNPHPAQRWRWEWPFVGSVVAQTIALVGSLWFVFSRESLLLYSSLYICFFPLIWICLRHGLPGGTLATLVLVMGSLVGMHYSPNHADSYLVSFLIFALAVAALGLGLGSAVTRRNEVQAQHAASRARFDRVIEGAQLGLWDWNVITGDVVYNDRCAEMLHCEPSRLAPTRDGWDGAIHPADRARNEEAMLAHLSEESPLYECEYRIHAQDGRWRWIHSRGSIVQRTSDGEPLLVSGTHVDITERKLAEATAKQLLAIVETTTDFVLTINSHGRVLYANHSLLKLRGLRDLSAIEGQPFTSVFPPSSADVLQAEVLPGALAKGSWHGELMLVDAQSRHLPASFVAIVHRGTEEDGSLLSFVMRDVSAQKLAEAANLEKERKIQQLQKAESLSVLTGGIAHDFNNLLTAVLGNAALLREELKDAGDKQAPLAQIEVAASRAAELCKTMLAYAGHVQLTLSDVDVNSLVQEARELVQTAISKKITVVTKLTDPLPAIKGSASQLQQVIINLALNAHEAIGDHPGTIEFRTSHREFRAQDLAGTFETLSAGHYVVLEVQDTGRGIPDSIRTKIFEPFFTTKPNGHGLGLSAVNGIIRAHGGAIRLQSTEGQGSLFQLLIPAMALKPQSITPPPPYSADWHGSGLALIVDDEDMVRTVMARLVERLGYATITASDGSEAVAIYRQRHKQLRFVLTDLTMPRMNGDEAMLQMRQIDPSVPILMMSGYPEKMTPDHFALSSPSALLVKPVRLQLLQKTLSQVLQPAASAPNPHSPTAPASHATPREASAARMTVVS